MGDKPPAAMEANYLICYLQLALKELNQFGILNNRWCPEDSCIRSLRDILFVQTGGGDLLLDGREALRSLYPTKIYYASIGLHLPVFEAERMVGWEGVHASAANPFYPPSFC